jgi:hypothetical protein
VTVEAQRAAIIAEIERHTHSAKFFEGARRWSEALTCAQRALALKRQLDAMEATANDGGITPIEAPPQIDASVLHEVDTDDTVLEDWEDFPNPEQDSLEFEDQIDDYDAEDDFEPDDAEESLQSPSAAPPQTNATDLLEVDTNHTPPADGWEDFPDADNDAPEIEDLLEDYDPSIVFEADDFDEALQLPRGERVPTDGLVGRDERAYQEAAKLATKYGWDEDGVQVMTEVFKRYFWSKAKTAMIAQLEAGMTPGQLRVALLARDVWAQSSEYHVSSSSTEFDLYVYPVMSWSMAVALGHELGDDAGEDDVLGFLDELLDEWRSSLGLLREFSSFYNYVRSYFDLYEEAPPRRRE